jgi:AraC-like DNA-binding protein
MPANSHDAASEPHALASETGAQAMAASRVDLLSQMLTLIRLLGELVFTAELTAPWALQFSPGRAYFHVVTEGSVIVQAGNAPPVHATTGDLLMVPHGDGHVVMDSAGQAPVLVSQLLAEQSTVDRLVLRHGGNGDFAQVIVGQFRFEHQSLPAIMAALPAVIHIRKCDSATAGWLEGLAHFLMVESQTPNPGSSLMVSRLIDLMVIRTLRTWAMAEETRGSGWLGALADARVSRALSAIHDAPFRRWTVAELAGVAGMSRSSFAERFAALVGEAPLHYQARWRLTLAVDLLQKPGARVGDVARQIGYDSDAAFSRAFKAMFGYAPVEARPR